MSKVDPGIQEEKAFSDLAPWKEDWDHRERVRFRFGLDVERKIYFALLPGAESTRTDENRGCARGYERSLDGRYPRSAA